VNAAISLLLEVPKGGDAALVQAALGRAYLAAFERSRDAAQAGLARRAIERAATLAPALPDVRVTLGQLLTATGQPKEAVVEIKKALELQPDSADALNALARALDKAGDPDGAEKAYQRATELRSSSWSSFNRLGAFYFATGRYEKAAEAFRTAISLNAGVAVTHGNLGGALLRLDRFDEAEAAFTRSIEIQPSPSAFSNLGTCQYLLGHFEQAAASFDKAATLVPKNFRYRAYLGDALTFVPGGAERARETYRVALALGEEELRVNPREAATRATLARCHARLGETGKAWAEVQQALALAPTDPNVLKRAAVVAAILGRKTEAFRLLGEAVSRGYGLAEIRRDPEFSAFRDDPRFTQILNAKTPS
jgi:Flp pilus assembly protein TadD